MTKKKSNRGKIILIIVLFIMVVAMGCGLFGYKTYLDRLKPVSQSGEKVVFAVEENMTGLDVLNKLHDEGLIRDVLAGRVYLKLHGGSNFISGNFALSPSMSFKEIMDILCNEKNAIIEQVEVTIIEGYWAKHAAAAIAEKTNLTEEQIMNKWNDVEYIYKLIDQYPFLTEDVFKSEHCYLEGFIYPETYRFYKETTVEEVTEKILDQQLMVFNKYKDQFGNSDYSIFELYTLASVLQFEARTEEDMKMCSGVFYNRFKAGMSMSASATVCYALYDKYTQWQDCEREIYIDSKYNTYKYQGLPVGPICNPSEKAINAAVNPTENDYYFFMSSITTGKMYYARTYQEHEMNINKYYH